MFYKTSQDYYGCKKSVRSFGYLISIEQVRNVGKAKSAKSN